MSQVTAPTPKKFHPALVSLHWLIALLVFTNIALAISAERGPDQIAGIPVMNIHMLFGISILLLLIVRLLIRFTTRHPAAADAGHPLLNKVGALTHWGLYLLVFGMTSTGIILTASTNRLARLFGLAVDPNRPRNELGLSIGEFHGVIAGLLMLLIFLHIGAALYHQFIRKDDLLSRMWFGKRYE